MLKTIAPLVTFLTLSACGTITTAPLRATEDGGAHAGDAGGVAGDSGLSPEVGSPNDAAGELPPPAHDAGPELGQADAGAEVAAPWPPASCEFHPSLVTPCNTSQAGLPCYSCIAAGVRMPAPGGAPCAQGDGVCTASCGGACE
jgi:hypothetical protein